MDYGKARPILSGSRQIQQLGKLRPHEIEIKTQEKKALLFIFYPFIVLLVNDCFVPLGVK